MKVYFDVGDVLHICPEDSVERLALKYWLKELKEHGLKVLDVDIEPHSELEKA
jgi:hypothetical protein